MKMIGNICNCGQCPFMTVSFKLVENDEITPCYELTCRRMLIQRGELRHIAEIPYDPSHHDWNLEAFAIPDWCPLEAYDGPYEQRGLTY